MRSQRPHRPLFALGALGLGLGLTLSACTRPTAGFCESDNDCSLGSYCELPAQECIQATVIRAELSGGQQVPATASSAAGSFRLIVSSDGTSGAYTFTHTVKQASFAQIRLGKIGQGNMGGQALITLSTTESSGTIELTPDILRSFTSGEVYLVMGSAAFPTGEIRGQLFSLDPQHASTEPLKLTGILSGLQSAPSNSSAGTGSIDLTYDEAAGTLAYSYTTTGTKTITGLHLHRGAFNVNGPHVVDMPGTTSTGSGTLTREDSCAQYKDQCHLFPVLIKSGLTYFNVHSSDFALGELRGQLHANSPVPFNTALSTKNLTLMAQSAALGEVHFYLSDDKLRLAYRIEHNASSPTSIELTKPNPTMGMPAIKLPCAALDASAGANGAQGYCDVTTDVMKQTAIQQSDLFGGAITVTVKTVQNPNGELRGDVRVPSR